MSFKFDLSVLSGTLVDELLPLTPSGPTADPCELPVASASFTSPTTDPMTAPPSKQEPLNPKLNPKSTGGAGLLTLDGINESEYDASFAITWVLLIKGCCISRQSRDWTLADNITRIFFLVSFVTCVGACIVAFLFQSTMFIPDNVHWFGWVVFIVFVVTEFIFMMARMLIGRYKNLMQRPERAEGQDVDDLWKMIISYESFNDGLQAWVTILLQLLSSTAFIAGVMFMVMQMDVTFEDEVHNTVGEDHRYSWRVGWVVAFGVTTLGLCVCGWLDAARLGEVKDDAPNWQIELIAWRVLLLTLVVPVLHTGYIIYCCVCCPGPLIWS